MKKFIRMFLFLACAFAFSQGSWADEHKGGKGTGECMQQTGDARQECLEEQMEHRDEMREGKGKKDKKGKKGKKDRDDDENDD